MPAAQIPRLVSPNPRIRAMARRVLRPQAGLIVPHLIELTEQGLEPDVLVGVIDLIGQIGVSQPELMRALLRLLHHADREVRLAVLRVCLAGRLPLDGHIDALVLGLTREADAQVRQLMTRLIVRQGGHQAVPPRPRGPMIVPPPHGLEVE